MALTSILALNLIVVFANANYHDIIDIPAATRIRERERRDVLGFPDAGINTRIVNGSEVPVGTYPWLAGLVITYEKSRRICGASLVSQNRLVTAAHCWVPRSGPNAGKQASLLEVVLGSQYLFYGGLRITTDTVITHPKWRAETHFSEYDAAVIYLPYDVTFNEHISPIKLPFDYIEESFVGYDSIAAGYGLLGDMQRRISQNASIHHVGLRVISNAECLLSYEDTMPWDLCTSGINGVGVCQGDSGGPLVTYANEYILIGIAARSGRAGCESGLPSAFTRVTEILDFISLHL